jgi:hypothetical protein
VQRHMGSVTPRGKAREHPAFRFQSKPARFLSGFSWVPVDPCWKSRQGSSRSAILRCWRRARCRENQSNPTTGDDRRLCAFGLSTGPGRARRAGHPDCSIRRRSCLSARRRDIALRGNPRCRDCHASCLLQAIRDSVESLLRLPLTRAAPGPSGPSQTRTSSLGATRPLRPSADIGPGGQSVGQAAQFCVGRPLPERLMSTPIRLTRPGCCARAASGHAAALPNSVMNSRRLILIAPGRGSLSDALA